MNYSTTEETNITLSYNTRLRPATYESESEANTIDIQNKTYTYLPDGAIKQAADNVESKFGQLYEYDFASRLKKNQFGTGSPTPTPQYKQVLGYDAFSNLTSRQTWDKDNIERSFTSVYTNDRHVGGGYGVGTNTHDNAGNVTRNIASTFPVDERNWKFDAAGRMTDWEETSIYVGTTRWDQGAKLTYDGDGRPVKRENRRRVWASPPTGWLNEPEYTIFSSVTGQPINQLDQYGAKRKTSVYMGSSVIAEQDCLGTCDFNFKNIDPITGSGMTVNASGAFLPSDSGRLELEPLGNVIAPQLSELQESHIYAKGGAIANPDYGCVDELTDAPAPCNLVELDQAYERCIWLGKCDEDKQNKKKRRSNLFEEEEEEDHKKKNWPDNLFPFDFVFADNKRRDKPGFIPEYVYGGGDVLRWHFTGRWIRMFTPVQRQDPCARMAARAQRVADEVYRDSVRITPRGTSTWIVALPSFDFNFNTLYIGHVVDGSRASIEYFANSSGGINSSLPAERGQQDFKNEFLDADFPRGSTHAGADQVHHFAAYFSAGINQAALSSYMHGASDTGLPLIGRWEQGANKGDQALANKAYELGYRVRRNPRLLAKIGESIRNEICQ